ncbi:DUF2690 domain-containing protein [Lentzea sp. NPDC006480]|uniref:DUF2690 domain-containing protein n=1 Tax=Lentzea sp. NPDC006480 TaxID=3157176 RepID=UPI0033AB6849
MRFGKTLTAVLFTVAAFIGLASPASAADRNGDWCGYQCDGQDPSSYVWHGAGGPSNWHNCSDSAEQAGSAYGAGYAVELRYSRICETVWARGTQGGWVERQDGVTASFSSDNSAPGAVRWSEMLNDRSLVSRACVHVSFGGDVCTRWY